MLLMPSTEYHAVGRISFYNKHSYFDFFLSFWCLGPLFSSYIVLEITRINVYILVRSFYVVRSLCHKVINTKQTLLVFLDMFLACRGGLHPAQGSHAHGDVGNPRGFLPEFDMAWKACLGHRGVHAGCSACLQPDARGPQVSEEPASLDRGKLLRTFFCFV